MTIELESLTRFVEGSPIKVLIVEDDEFDATLLIQALQTVGEFSAIECRNGIDAVRFFETGGRVSLAFIDISLPGGMDGWQVLSRIRQLNTEVRCVIYTGTERDIPMSKILAAGAVSLISKPPTPESLRQLVRADFRV